MKTEKYTKAEKRAAYLTRACQLAAQAKLPGSLARKRENIILAFAKAGSSPIKRKAGPFLAPFL